MIQEMRAIQVHDYGDADQLKLEYVPRPVPQAGEVLVRVHAAGVNPIDWKVRQGLRKEILPMRFPYIPGMEMAGVVEDVGPGVTAFEIGQAVYGSARGAYAEYTVAAVASLALKPHRLSFDEAATIPVGATTAWQGLFDAGKLEAGQRVLIQGAAGGVGLFAVQFAHWKGAEVIATASSANVDFVHALGADIVVNYATTDLARVVHNVDLAFDPVGGTALAASIQTIKYGGTLVAIGSQPDAGQLQERTIHVASTRTQIRHDLLKTFTHLIDEGHVQAAIKRVFPLSEACQAHELGQQGSGRGRIVLHIA